MVGSHLSNGGRDGGGGSDGGGDGGAGGDGGSGGGLGGSGGGLGGDGGCGGGSGEGGGPGGGGDGKGGGGKGGHTPHDTGHSAPIIARCLVSVHPPARASWRQVARRPLSLIFVSPRASTHGPHGGWPHHEWRCNRLLEPCLEPTGVAFCHRSCASESGWVRSPGLSSETRWAGCPPSFAVVARLQATSATMERATTALSPAPPEMPADGQVLPVAAALQSGSASGGGGDGGADGGAGGIEDGGVGAAALSLDDISTSVAPSFVTRAPGVCSCGSDFLGRIPIARSIAFPRLPTDLNVAFAAGPVFSAVNSDISWRLWRTPAAPTESDWDIERRLDPVSPRCGASSAGGGGISSVS